jgi:hypothetical protein
MIHTIGDSHACNGWANTIKQNNVDSILAFSFGRDKLNRIDIRNYNIRDGDTVIFCMGEIDCRCHIHKYITNKVTYENIIDNIIDSYFEAIKLNIDVSGIKLKNVCVYNVVPPIDKNTFKYANSMYPHLGSNEERKMYILYFNKKIKEKCAEYNYIFFDIYNYYIDKNGFLDYYLSDENVHIKNGIYIDKFIIENNI